ncbi:MAG: 2,3-bisphosphoglycerate-independent phosphoglycerate mutase [SAR202 cluster bacterium]|jgi:2,3-bisphosphoglycerate-independent phosphoglycerate mutase|nr:2,3-bisphosphoglycerate-independent phosphoglycerate mutase [Dehalococcoidia bacterium]MDP7578660.1 2,3-bisphosphoglycerate-independent phosphoglycerate mutase [SAR202 cluster bacterium]
MIDFPYIKQLTRPTDSKIIMLVIDGLGGYPNPDTRKSELETANLPNLDRIAQESSCGLTNPTPFGITLGSGPGHMALFGYDPVKYLMGRGILEAIGIGMDLGKDDVAARGNFCTIDSNGCLVDRRAGRISSEDAQPLINRLDKITLEGVQVSVQLVRDYRFVLVLHGDGLGDQVSETDPQNLGVPMPEATALSEDSHTTAASANNFIAQARRSLNQRVVGNMVMLRGFSRLPSLPQMTDLYHLRPAAIASYPMYRGIAQLLGMRVLETGDSFEHQIATLEQHYSEYDFFFLHYKPADAAGEDGNFGAKVDALEKLDQHMPEILKLDPHTLVVTGDHATPSIFGSHSWHKVPLMIRSSSTRGDGVQGFSEKSMGTGSMGTVPATNTMLLSLAHADKLRRFGP